MVFAADISSEEVLDCLREMVKIPSINPPANDDTCAKMIANWLSEQGIKSEVIYSNRVANVVAELEGLKGKGPTLLWNGHYDVVPPGEDWTINPFEGKVEGGVLYGRGACDMKAGLTAMMFAMRSLQARREHIRGKIVFTAVGDEETGSKNGTLFLLEKGYGTGADFAMNAEPTDLRIELGNRGLRWLEVMVKGKAAHAGRPFLGKNAVEHAAKIIKGLSEISFSQTDKRFAASSPSVTPTMLQGGIQLNIVPDRCTLGIDRRMIPGETEEMVIHEIQQVLDEVAEEGFSAEIKILNKGWDPYYISESEPVVQALEQEYKKVMKEKPVFKGKSGSTDASHLYHNGGIPTVLFGPGSASYAHKPDERVDLESVVQAAQIYYLTALNLLR